MKSKKYLIIGVVILLLIISGIFGIKYFFNSNRLTINEKNWIDENHSTSQVININVLNNSFVFGNNGKGLFYDLLEDFKNEYDLNLNEVTYNYGSAVSGVSLGAKTELDKKDILLYEDHYVLIGKQYEIINNISNLSNKEIGITSSDLAYVSRYLNGINANYKSYEDSEKLLTAMNEEISYAIVPLHMCLGNILSNNYEIIYHISDAKIHYVLSTTDDVLSSVLKKYYKNWNESFLESYNKNLFEEVRNSLNISETELDAMRSITYKYGYTNNSPYEVISNGNYGGIVAVYLKDFTDFADVDFKFTKYRNIRKFNKALAKDEIDIYFGYYNIDNNYSKTNGGIIAEYSVIANSKNPLVVNSINTLVDQEVYVDANSTLYNYLKSINGINIKTYNNSKELLKLNKKDKIIFIDSNIYEYYKNHGLEDYTERYSGYLNNIYGFKTKNNSALYTLLNKFISIKDSNEVLNEGLYNHEVTVNSGIVLSLIAKYFIYIIIILLIVGFFVIRKTRKITVAKKIKKDDKLRFIDQLTLLKNRNYLSENIKEWSNNTIYPQTILVIDLNHLQHINDIEGYEEGDKQIKSAANALIKTQLDNSDIIRTDGNEFVVYLVGYSQKQITNYIHKLNKEFKKLPYNYGAEFGYSMILDDIKTIEDALNEATKQLKKQKELNEEKN